MTAGLDATLAALRTVVGDAHVTTDAAARARVEAATFRTRHRVPAIVRPADRDEVAACLRIATRDRVPVYPVSRGRNWGYGSRVPVRDGCVVLQLDRLDRIVDLDERLGCVTVEPGVTFAAVQALLAARGAPFTLTAPGSTDQASVIGHALERGIVAGPHGDRADEVCGLEVVLADGSVVHTGLAPWTGARAAPVARHGLGPALDGLFFQSNLGVVTRATIFLDARPQFAQRVTFRADARARLGPLADGLRALIRDGVLDAGAQLHNAHKVLTLIGRRPPAGPDPARAGRWFGAAEVTAADEAIGLAKQQVVRRALDRLVDHAAFGEPAAGPLDGGAAAPSLASAYYRHPRPPPADPDPDRDRCGLLWCCPLVPFDGGALLEAVGLVEETLTAHGLDPVVGAQALSARALHVIGAIQFDRDDPAREEAALACHDALLARLFAAGLLPYRVAGPARPTLAPMSDGDRAVRARLKAALDPAGILAPGRYEP